jgi:hypothetical protein
VNDTTFLTKAGHVRERRKAPTTSKAAAERWAAARERVLLVSGKPKPVQTEEVNQIPTLREFGDRFIDAGAGLDRCRSGKRQLCVARSDWKGHVTAPKGGKVRYVLLT